MKVEQPPERGEIVIAHTLNEKYARLAAGYLETDYMLHRYCPPDMVYVINFDTFKELFGASRPFE